MRTLLRLAASFLYVFLSPDSLPAGEQVSVRISGAVDVRMEWGKKRLEASLKKAGYELKPDGKLVVDISAETRQPQANGNVGPAESCRLVASKGRVSIIGADPAGAMYGCIEIAQEVQRTGRLPDELNRCDGPKIALRGTCVLLMKLGNYDLPVAPKEFPFFYDRRLWIEYLDFLAENRYNYIAFWNGHPFDYFVKLDKYPEGQDGMEAGLLAKNHQTLLWLAKEAERRNIWLMFHFYNIHTSVYFQKAHGFPSCGHSAPTPLLTDYTTHCIERFVSEFPRIGLYVCPGEALSTTYSVDWLKNVIFAAVKRTGKTPPIIVRAWGGIDLPHMKQLCGAYPRLYTERKYNVEHLAADQVDPENRDWSKCTGNHVVNIHCLGNLEPFRWSPPSYVQRCVQSSIRDGGATGLHVWPRKGWRWPYGCDRVNPPEVQWVRDWMWFEVWARYAWNPDRDPAAEKQYWTTRLAERYGDKAAPHVLRAFEESADVLPGLQRLIWRGDSNHTVLAAGITLGQLEKAEGIKCLPLPGVIRIPQCLKAARAGATLSGQTPIVFFAMKVKEAEAALEEAKFAAKAAACNQFEVRQLAWDLQAEVYLARFYRDKFAAVVAKVRQEAGIDKVENHKTFLRELQASVDDYRLLTALTRRTYESISDVPAWNPTKFLPCPYHCSDIERLFEFEQELAEGYVGSE